MRKYTRIIAGVLAVLISAGATGLYAVAQDDKSSDKNQTASSQAEKENSGSDDNSKKEQSDNEAQAEKEETVYVLYDSGSNIKDVIVSDWLKNTKGSDTLEDISDLTDIKNVKGDEIFTDNGGKLSWQADGNDIYYRGNSDKQLPVDVKITYLLDGAETAPENMLGKSGKVTIRYTYTNNQKTTKKINGKDIEVYVPFLMASGTILDGDKFSNVEVTNGKVISDGNRLIVLGMAVPGLSESLGLDNLEDLKDADIQIPETVEITADVKDFETTASVTVATGELFSQINFDDTETFDELSDKIDELSKAADDLCDGTAKLYKGISDLSDGAGDLSDGIKKLYDGSSKLKSGAGDLYNGSKQLSDGAKTLYNSVGKLSGGISDAKNGSSELVNGISKVQNGSKELVNGADSLKSGISDLFGGGNVLSEGAKTLSDGMGQLVTGTKTLNASAKLLSDGITDAKKGADTLLKGVQSAEDGVSNLLDGSGELKQGAAELSAGMDDAAGGLGQTIYADQQVLSGLKQMLAQTEEGTEEYISIKTMIETLEQSIGGQQQICLLYTSPSPRDTR